MNDQDMKYLEDVKERLGITSNEEAVKSSLRFRHMILLGTQEEKTVIVSRLDNEREIAAILKSNRKRLEGGKYTTAIKQGDGLLTVRLPSLNEFTTVEAIQIDPSSSITSRAKGKTIDNLSSAYLSGSIMDLLKNGFE